MTDAHLRRLGDEPLAIPDRVTEHLERCPRCQERLARISASAHHCASRLGGPQPVPDIDAAWAQLVRALQERSDEDAPRARTPLAARRAWRVRRLPLRTALAAGAIGVVIGGSAVAATLTSVFAPTHVAPVSLTQSDVGALTSLMGLGAGSPGARGQSEGLLGGFPGSSGSLTTSFGTVTWSSSGSGRPHVAATLADAVAQAGFPVALPAKLPDGVSARPRLVVQPSVHVTLKLAGGLRGVGGSSIVLDTGPAVLALYGSAGGPQVPTLVVLTMPRPTAVASGATASQIEDFVLAQPGVPADLAQEVRLLGDLSTTLPVPVPAGAIERSIQVAGSPGLLVADPSGAATGIIWEDHSGVIRAVAGLLDQQDALDVADQLG